MVRENIVMPVERDGKAVDEPTGNLDEETGEEVLKLLKKSSKEFNQTLILVTHDLDLAKQADKIIEIKDGHVMPIKDNIKLN